MDGMAGAVQRLIEAVERLERMHARPELPAVLTVLAAAEQLSVSERTMRSLLDSGEVASVRIGGRRMVPRTEIERLAQPVALTAGRRKAVASMPAVRLDVSSELEELAAVKRSRARG
jgi:excisionase family DNA binding protein